MSSRAPFLLPTMCRFVFVESAQRKKKVAAALVARGSPSNSQAPAWVACLSVWYQCNGWILLHAADEFSRVRVGYDWGLSLRSCARDEQAKDAYQCEQGHFSY